jgi:hypothetical protein
MDLLSYKLGKNAGGGGEQPESEFNIKADFSNSTGTISNYITKIDKIDIGGKTVIGQMFQNCNKLEEIPYFDSSTAKDVANLFGNCTKLKTVPLLNTSNITTFTNMFYNCPALSNASLDRILQMCINASAYKRTKTLATLGLTSTNYPSSTIEALPHYQDFIDAGWAIGY